MVHLSPGHSSESRPLREVRREVREKLPEPRDEEGDRAVTLKEWLDNLQKEGGGIFYKPQEKKTGESKSREDADEEIEKRFESREGIYPYEEIAEICQTRLKGWQELGERLDKEQQAPELVEFYRTTSAKLVESIEVFQKQYADRFTQVKKCWSEMMEMSRRAARRNSGHNRALAYELRERVEVLRRMRQGDQGTEVHYDHLAELLEAFNASASKREIAVQNCGSFSRTHLGVYDLFRQRIFMVPKKDILNSVLLCTDIGRFYREYYAMLKLNKLYVERFQDKIMEIEQLLDDCPVSGVRNTNLNLSQ